MNLSLTALSEGSNLFFDPTKPTSITDFRSTSGSVSVTSDDRFNSPAFSQGLTADFQITGISVVPEPCIAVLLIFSGLGFIVMAYRRTTAQ